MTVFTTRLLGREQLAEGTVAFHLEKPQGFVFQPGQAVDLLLVEPGSAQSQDVRHTFSLVSAPHEAQLTLATRMRDSQYKNTLAALPDGAPLYLDGPFGSALVPDASPNPLVLIAGGIGITPFVSIVRDAVSRQISRPLLLLYSNRRPEDAAFLAELQQMEQQLSGFRLVATMTRADSSAVQWEGPVGYLDAERICEYSAEFEKPLYYLSGPPALVENLRDMLEDAGVDEDVIYSESFTGY